ncbi:MAG: hypothetical protein HWN65_03285 [Candidatus Helarchaeota archaeon]|nr:hypothetical protein [Candidatus Helarchaeota archaeon]
MNQNTIPKYLNLIVDKFIKLQISGPTKLYYLTTEGREKGKQLLAQK